MSLSEVTVIIPAYNEEKGIGKILQELRAESRLAQTEIIVIDDGSMDKTTKIVSQYPDVRLIKHRGNKGYGTAIKTGTRVAKNNYIVWFDADGQHRIEDLIKVASTLVNKDLEYCIGIRDDRSYQDPNRSLGKTILKYTVWLAAGQKVADFNSGLRGFRKDVLARYTHLLPKGFGASTTTTLLMLEQEHFGEEVPIVVHERVGKSSVKILRDGIGTLMIILRIFLLFKPLLFFGGIGSILIVGGSIYGFYEALRYRQGFPVFAALIIILGVQALFFGILNDQISQLRRERLD